MSRSIRVNVDYSECKNTYYYRDFSIADKLPDIEFKLDELTSNDKLRVDYPVFAIDSVEPDCENSSNVWDYDYFVVKSLQYNEYHWALDDALEGEKIDIEDYIDYAYYAIPKVYDEDDNAN